MDIIQALSGFVMKPTLRDPARTPYFGSAQAPEPFVRDLARKRGKDVELTVAGAEEHALEWYDVSEIAHLA